MMSGGEKRILMTARSGISALVSTRGASLVALSIPDRRGQFDDVVLGFDTVEEYESNTDAYLGSTIGRVANRIGGAAFALDGRTIEVTANEGRNSRHGGGSDAFDSVHWSVSHLIGTDADSVTFTLHSPDGAEGYPGNVEATTTYTLSSNALRIDWTGVPDQWTPLNITNHAYWNLAGAGNGTIEDHDLELNAGLYTPVDDELIPIGHHEDVTGTPFDFRDRRRIGDRIDQLLDGPGGGYDHNIVFDPSRDPARPVARLSDRSSGRVMSIRTDHVGVQFYTGNFLTDVAGKGGKPYGWRSGLCLEPQSPPDTLNRPGFGTVMVEPGETYRRWATFTFTVDRDETGDPR